MNKNLLLLGGVLAVVVLFAGYQHVATKDYTKSSIAVEEAQDAMHADEVNDKAMEGHMSSSSEREDVIKDSMMAASSSVMVKDKGAIHDATVKGEGYIPYDPAKFALAKDGHVVLFFRASWCPTCRNLDSDIKNHLKDIPTNLTILDVDYDNSTDLKKKYGVTYQHTLVQVDAVGNMLKKWSGSPTLAALVFEVK